MVRDTRIRNLKKNVAAGVRTNSTSEEEEVSDETKED